MVSRKTSRGLALCLLAAIVTVGVAGENSDFEDKHQRPSIFKRGTYSRGGPSKGVTSSSSTTTPPPEDDQYDDVPLDESDFEDDAAANEEPTAAPTTSENPRKIKGGVRPFRSNDDLLATLKRRRAEAASGKLPYFQKEASTSPPVESYPHAPKASPGKKRFQTHKVDLSFHGHDEPGAPPPPAKAYRGRFSPKGNRPSPAAESEISVLESSQQPVEVKPKSGFRSSRGRF